MVRLTGEEKERIAELLRMDHRDTYRAIARLVGRSANSVFEIALALEEAGEIPTALIGRPRNPVVAHLPRPNPGSFATDRERASEAGRKGGQESQRLYRAMRSR